MILFSILIVIVLIFYAFSMIVKLIFNRKIKRLNREMEHFAQNETKDNASNPQNPRINPNIGEYTDFEEVE
jgi:predicted PurR-regulated permease PerM